MNCDLCGKEPRKLIFAMRNGQHEVSKCLWCALRHGPMLKRSGWTALVVGTILLLINQGDTMIGGEFYNSLIWKVPLTYTTPFLVTTWGALSNARR